MHKPAQNLLADGEPILRLRERERADQASFAGQMRENSRSWMRR
jgi:hypothetical protein